MNHKGFSYPSNLAVLSLVENREKSSSKKKKKKKKSPRTTETGDGFDRSNIKPSLNRA